jgi:GxxExxY protein
MSQILYKDEVYALVGAAMDVYNELGSGFLEAVYQEALEIEMKLHGIPFKSQQELYIFYKGRKLKKTYTPDLLCYDKIVVDLKAIEHLTPVEYAKMKNYLKGTKFELGLLLNFGNAPQLETKRIILSRFRKSFIILCRFVKIRVDSRFQSSH